MVRSKYRQKTFTSWLKIFLKAELIGMSFISVATFLFMMAIHSLHLFVALIAFITVFIFILWGSLFFINAKAKDWKRNHPDYAVLVLGKKESIFRLEKVELLSLDKTTSIQKEFACVTAETITNLPGAASLKILLTPGRHLLELSWQQRHSYRYSDLMSELLRQELQIIAQPGRTYYIPIPEEDSGFKIQNLNERRQDLKEKKNRWQWREHYIPLVLAVHVWVAFFLVGEQDGDMYSAAIYLSNWILQFVLGLASCLFLWYFFLHIQLLARKEKFLCSIPFILITTLFLSSYGLRGVYAIQDSFEKPQTVTMSVTDLDIGYIPRFDYYEGVYLEEKQSCIYYHGNYYVINRGLAWAIESQFDFPLTEEQKLSLEFYPHTKIVHAYSFNKSHSSLHPMNQ